MIACSKTKPSECRSLQGKSSILKLLFVGLSATFLFIKVAYAQDAGLLERMERLENDFRDLKQVLAVSLLASIKPCAELPGEWVEASEFSGKFLLGSDASYAAGSEGGSAQVQLTIENMPHHGHPIGPFEWGHTINGSGNPARIDVDDGPPWEGRTGGLEANGVGGGLPHDNMPPYRVVSFCKYEED